ncbi:DNA internalization-related competence protein ComEC/Rec2 [Chitinilyticum piscinae]|uniref:DNA internalization-related competence protein ComEC/Rec2 n=1 Tax=Chitinilyticum piscinae TaxID=2866724 RepID=A0A8J7FLI6_9NEIS|nr:DNA internalization-related competence protein ComEC/Rec2 [Chitinilyticum piscinae]MBE9610077.1 DNA internalization-related competence protein ComEC/Rec2 [Chitinilyticum piscinae]
MLLRLLLPMAAFVAGVVLLHQQTSLPAASSLPLLFLPGLLAMSLRRTRMLGSLLLALALGICHASWQARTRLEQRLPAALEGQTMELRGRIEGLPQNARNGLRLVFAPDPGQQDGLPARILLRWYKPSITPVPGQRWQFTVSLKRPHGMQNPASFDAESWLLQENLGATGTIRSGTPLQDSRLSAPVDQLRSLLQQRMETALGHSEYAGVIIALAIGEQSAIPAEQWQRFAATGITHLVSISGLHITLLAALAALATRSIWRRIPRLCSRFGAPRAAIIAGVCTAIIYSLLAGMSIPTQRTLIMLLLAALALWQQRPWPGSLIWLAALALVVTLDPFAVLSPGFWLSFLTVGALLWAGLASLRTGARWQGWIQTQWAATLATAPLLLLWFGQLPLYSPLANAIAIPLVSLLVTPLTLLGLLDPSDELLQLAAKLFGWLDLVLQQLAAAPHATLRLAAPSAWALLLAAGGVTLLLAPRGLSGRWLGGIALLPALTGSPPQPLADGEFAVTVFDIGQGLSVQVQTRSHSLLFDTGPPGSERLLASQFPTAPDVLVLSHNDNDHIGAAAALLAQFPHSTLWHSLPSHHPLLAGRTVHSCTAGQSWEWNGIAFRWLWPPAGFSGSDNASSCTLLIDNGHQRILIPADMGLPEEALLLADALPDIDVLVAGHHGSKNSTGSDWLAALQPEHVIYSAGYRNRFGHPAAATRQRVQAQGSREWRTDLQGAILIRGGRLLELHAWRELQPRYWYTAGNADSPDAP